MHLAFPNKLNQKTACVIAQSFTGIIRDLLLNKYPSSLLDTCIRRWQILLVAYAFCLWVSLVWGVGRKKEHCLQRFPPVSDQRWAFLMTFIWESWNLKNFTYSRRKPQQNQPLLLTFTQTKPAWTASKTNSILFLLPGIQPRPREVHMSQGRTKVGAHEHTSNLLSSSSPCCIKRHIPVVVWDWIWYPINSFTDYEAFPAWNLPVSFQLSAYLQSFWFLYPEG